MAIAGTTSKAATSIGHSKRCSMACARSFTGDEFDGRHPEPSLAWLGPGALDALLLAGECASEFRERAGVVMTPAHANAFT
jgi:hypothetical protein